MKPRELGGGSSDIDSEDGEDGQRRQLHIYDPYNRVIPKDQEATTTLRTNHTNGNPQIIVQNPGASQHYRVYGKDGLAPTLQSQSGMSSQKHPFILAHYGHKNKEAVKMEISPTLKANSHGHEPMIVASRGREPNVLTPKRTEYGKKIRKDYESGKIKEQRKNIQQLEPRTDGITNTLTGVEKDNYVFDGKIRKLMPIETERLMSWPDEWTRWGINEKGETVEISDSQRYKMCGNGVVSNVVKEIVKILL